MDTTIVKFHQDDAGDWVAELACGHGQHMRHMPPWQERPWVTTEEGRQRKIGARIECALCDAILLPLDAREFGAGDVGIVEPEVPHHVTPLGPVCLHVEFWRAG